MTSPSYREDRSKLSDWTMIHAIGSARSACCSVNATRRNIDIAPPEACLIAPDVFAKGIGESSE